MIIIRRGGDQQTRRRAVSHGSKEESQARTKTRSRTPAYHNVKVSLQVQHSTVHQRADSSQHFRGLHHIEKDEVTFPDSRHSTLARPA